MWARSALLRLLVSHRSIFKLVLAAYFLFELLPNDVTRRCTAAGATFDSENGLINGKVIRVLVFNVNNKIITSRPIEKFSLKFYNFLDPVFVSDDHYATARWDYAIPRHCIRYARLFRQSLEHQVIPICRDVF